MAMASSSSSSSAAADDDPDKEALWSAMAGEPKRPSTFRGVTWENGLWRASISCSGGRSKGLGVFALEEDAARAYDRAAREVYEYPVLNFNQDGSINADRKKQVSPQCLGRRKDSASKDAASPALTNPRRRAHASAAASAGGGDTSSDDDNEEEANGRRGRRGGGVTFKEEEDDDDDEARRKPKSSFIGVHWSNGKWVARVWCQGTGQHRYLGIYHSEVAAAREYDHAARRLFKDAVLNFLPGGIPNPERHAFLCRRVLRPRASSAAASSRSLVPRQPEAEASKRPASTSSRRREEGKHDDEGSGSEATTEVEEEDEGTSGRRNSPDYGASSFRGVYSRCGKWKATIRYGGHVQRLGSFASEEEAARAYDRKAVQLHGNPVLNFNPDGSINADRKKAMCAYKRGREPLTNSSSQARITPPSATRPAPSPVSPVRVKVEEQEAPQPPPPPQRKRHKPAPAASAAEARASQAAGSDRDARAHQTAHWAGGGAAAGGTGGGASAAAGGGGGGGWSVAPARAAAASAARVARPPSNSVLREMRAHLTAWWLGLGAGDDGSYKRALDALEDDHPNPRARESVEDAARFLRSEEDWGRFVRVFVDRLREGRFD